MNYLSVCSGIEAATVAWHDIGFNPVGFSEIEPFPAAALQHHYPNVTNFGDMTKFKEWNLDPSGVDLLVGGTPCQSFSVAGLRKGLDDPRGNLALVYCSMLDYFRPKWFVWENVPGVLSSNGGRDFGSFLGAVAELGYGFSYRVLDAQYFGVAQRRRRVFVVGHLGGWQRPAAVLFEQQSLRRDTAPSRETGKSLACGVSASLTESGVPDVAQTLSTRDHKGPSCGRDGLVGNPIAVPAYGIPGNWIGRKPENGGNAVEPMHDVAPCLTKTDKHGVAHPVFPLNSMTFGRENEKNTRQCLGVGQVGDPQFTLSKAHSHAVAHPIIGGIDYENNAHGPDEVTGPLLKGSPTGGGRPLPAVAFADMAVRRLTPVECERLQGFPDNYTNIPWRKSSESPDGPRYKALGNSMAVPVMRWIGERIKQVESIK